MSVQYFVCGVCNAWFKIEFDRMLTCFLMHFVILLTGCGGLYGGVRDLCRIKYTEHAN